MARGVHINALSHYECAKLSEGCHRLLGFIRMFMKVWHKRDAADHCALKKICKI